MITLCTLPPGRRRFQAIGSTLRTLGPTNRKPTSKPYGLEAEQEAYGPEAATLPAQ